MDDGLVFIISPISCGVGTSNHWGNVIIGRIEHEGGVLKGTKNVMDYGLVLLISKM